MTAESVVIIRRPGDALNPRRRADVMPDWNVVLHVCRAHLCLRQLLDA